MPIKLTSFQGMVPRREPHKLGDTQAQLARNCSFDGENLAPLRERLFIASLPDALRQTIYKYNGGWLSWPTDVDVVKCPIPDDSYQRIYYTGDGVPKMRGISGGVELEYDLGVPAPAAAPVCSVVAKASTSWTRQWGYFWEETDGTQMDAGTLAENGGVVVTTAGKTYTVGDVSISCPKPTASSTAKLVVWFDAYTAAGVYLGRMYPQHSIQRNATTLYIDGAQVTGNQTTDTSAVLTLTYNSSDAVNYTADRAYVYTFVSAWGEEGPPSPLSATVTVDPTKDVSLSGMDTTCTASNVTKKRIYRTATGVNDATEYQFVAEIDLATYTYLDSLSDADLGEVIASTDWDPPPVDIMGLVSCPGGFLAAFKGNTVYFSEPWQPHAWPSGYSLSVDYDIVGLGVTGNALIVMTGTVPYAMVGSAPGAITVTRLPFPQGCMAKRSVCEFRSSIFYASPDGLVLVDGGNARLITDQFYTRDDWQALEPDTMIVCGHDNLLHILCQPGGVPKQIVFDFETDGSILVEADEQATAFYVDPTDDTLYMIDGTSVYSWGGAITYKTATWKSRRYLLPRDVSFAAARLSADAYPVTLRAYSNGTLVNTSTVLSEDAFRLPQLRPEKSWEFEIETTHAVNTMTIGTSIRDLDQ